MNDFNDFNGCNDFNDLNDLPSFMEFKVMQGNQSNYEQQIDDVIVYSDVQYSFHKHGGKSDSYKSGDCPKEVCTYSSHSLHLIVALITIMFKN